MTEGAKGAALEVVAWLAKGGVSKVATVAAAVVGVAAAVAATVAATGLAPLARMVVKEV